MIRAHLAFAAAAAGFLLGGAQPPAPERPLPEIAAPSTTAPFTATRGNVMFDGTCRGLTFETLPARAACAERVARGETGSTLEFIGGALVAAHTPANVGLALDMLDRAIAAEDHPAALYLAGTLLTTGEVVPPDYVRGIPYLERAVAGGNVAAADLLAALVIEGRGAPIDVNRTIALFERAAAGGMQGSAVRLAYLYLDGRHLPPQRERARQILERAAAAGIRGASETLAMLAADGRMHNFQLYPNADPARVEVREHRTFDNPAIPPAFGFTDDFQRLHRSAYSDPEILARLEREHAALPTPYLYELARRIVPVSADRARGYYLLARLRMTYDVRRCAEPQAAEALSAWDRIVARDLRPALLGITPEQLAAAVAFALEREAALPADTRPWWVCYAGLASFSAMTEGRPPPLRLVAESEWPRLRREARDQLAARRLPQQGQ